MCEIGEDQKNLKKLLFEQQKKIIAKKTGFVILTLCCSKKIIFVQRFFFLQQNRKMFSKQKKIKKLVRISDSENEEKKSKMEIFAAISLLTFSIRAHAANKKIAMKFFASCMSYAAYVHFNHC